MRTNLERNISAAFSTAFQYRQHIDEFDLLEAEVNYAQSLGLPLDYVTPLEYKSSNIVIGKRIYERRVSATDFLSACTGYMLAGLFYNKGMVAQDRNYLTVIDCLPTFDYYYEDLGVRIYNRKVEPKNKIGLAYSGVHIKVEVENVETKEFLAAPAFILSDWYDRYQASFGINYTFVDMLRARPVFADQTTAEINEFLATTIESLLPRREPLIVIVKPTEPTSGLIFV